VDGESAHEQFLERGPAAEAEVLNLAADTARGLAAIHAEGLLHLDLKPANLLITRREGLAKILDLGLARPQGYIPEGRVFGTAGYVSPEQIMGFPATRASDLYGLGVTIYELLAGRHAYESSETMPRLARQLERELADIRTLRRDVSAATAELVKACVCMDPQQRPRSAAALLELLNAAWQALPARPAARMRPVGTTEVRSPQAPRVVSVDDDPKVCELLAAILREEGFEVEAFRDAHEALGILLRDPPCVAILDVEMPGLNGLEVCQELRRSPAGAQIPVVFLTGRMDPELVEEALKLGASDYLFKPFHAADLVARVRCLARIGETRRELAALDEQYRDFRKHLAGYEKGTAP
jgi:CheY-like chemotaxis protein